MISAGIDCPATGTITIDGETIVVICNLAPHTGPDRHDVVHGDWTSPGP